MQNYKAAVLLLLFLFLAGCGSAAVGAAIYFAPEDKEPEEETTSPDAPVVIVSNLTDVQSGDIDISYTITDISSDPVNLVVEYTIDSWASTATVVTESTDPRSDGVAGLASSPTGVTHLFVWDSLSDIGTGTYNQVRFRITPSDTEPGAPAATLDFTVDNTPPTVEIIPLTGIQSGAVAVAYKIYDGAGDPTDITVEYSTDGGTGYSPASEQTLSPFTEGTTSLASSSIGILHIFVWDSTTDCPGYRCDTEDPQVRIRITPSDFLSGLSVATGKFALDNNIAPLVVVETPGAPLPKKGNVTINYTLYDAESDECTISVQYSVTSGLFWDIATKGSGGDPITHLESSSTGTSHTFIWNSIANLGYCSETQVMIRITPYDTKWGIRSETGLFPVDNNLAPSASIVTPTEVKSGDVYLLYYLFDGGGDIIEIVADFSPNGGQDWYPATLSGSAPEGTTPLQSAPSGYPHFFLWDTNTDMPGGYSNNVIFRIKPTDQYANEGDYALSGEFSVSNNSPPSVVVANPSSPSIGDVLINYDLYDSDSPLCDVIVEYSMNGTGDWQPATMASGSELTTQLSASGAGVAHTFTWDSATDIDKLEENVRVRITPYDFPDRAGTPGTTASFTVDNAQWSTPVQVTTSTNTSAYPAVHASADGVVHLVWCEYVINKYQIYYSKKSGNEWSEPQDISSGTNSCYYPDVVAGAEGVVHVTWFMPNNYNDNQVFYRKFDGSKWLTTVQLTNSNDHVDAPSVDLDESGNPWVAYAQTYSGNYRAYISRYDGVAWLPQEMISTSTSHKFVTLRSGPGGTMHLANRRDYDEPGRIFYNSNNGTAWSSYETVSEYGNYYLLEPDLSIDSSGNAYVVWTRNSRPYYSTNAGGSWSSTLQLQSNDAERPQVAAYSPNNVLVAFSDNNDTIYYSHFNGSDWSLRVRIDVGTGAAREPYMRKGADGRVHLAYYQWVGSYWQIQYASR